MKIMVGSFALLILVFFAFNTNQASQTKNINKLTTNSNVVKDSTKTVKKKETVKENIGIGPIKELKLGAINEKLVKEGKTIFNTKCFACHRLDSKLVGPALNPIVKKISPVYLMNYLLNTTEMQKKEPELKKLIKESNGIVMPDQGLNKSQARAVVEYLRSNIKK
jgi:cytochrome c551/c552